MMGPRTYYENVILQEYHRQLFDIYEDYEVGNQVEVVRYLNSLDERLCVANSLPYAIERSGQAIMGYSQLASSASAEPDEVSNLATSLSQRAKHSCALGSGLPRLMNQHLS